MEIGNARNSKGKKKSGGQREIAENELQLSLSMGGRKTRRIPKENELFRRSVGLGNGAKSQKMILN